MAMRTETSDDPYDAILFVSFGGPEGRDDVIPFLENVLRGRNVPRERMLEVAEHYYHFDGVSPINQQTRDLIEAVTPELERRSIDLPIYWGNRNWTPMLADTMAQMKADGIRRALAFVVAGYSSYSSCRQYREDIVHAQQEVGDDASAVDKIRVFYNHPDFIAASADRVQAAIDEIARSQGVQPLGLEDVHVAYTAHSIPESMAENCDYVQQLEETCRLISADVGVPADRYQLVYQSRSGRPQDPWLEPDIVDHVHDLADRGVQSLVIMPVGFLSDHMEVMFDLDEEAAQAAQERSIAMARAKTVGTHPRFVEMIGKLIEERVRGGIEREAIGRYGVNHDVCPQDCCPAPQRPSSRPVAS